MTKTLLLVWCLVFSVGLSSYNAQFIVHPNHPSFEAQYPLLDPQEQLDLKNLNKLNDRLKDKYLKTESMTLPVDKVNSGGSKNNIFSAIIKEVLKAVMKYAESYLAPLFPSQFRTVTITEKKTSYFSCTVSTTACVGRHRRAVIKHLLEKQTALPLAYSMLVNEPAPDIFNLGDDKKEIFSDYLNPSSPSYGSLSYHDPELLEGSMTDPVTTSLNENSSLSHLINIQQLPPNQAATLLSRLGLNTITTTITNYTSKTLTSHPVCSTKGDVSQCPN